MNIQRKYIIFFRINNNYIAHREWSQTKNIYLFFPIHFKEIRVSSGFFIFYIQFYCKKKQFVQCLNKNSKAISKMKKRTLRQLNTGLKYLTEISKLSNLI